MKLKILYLYSEKLNLYGDRGNVEVLVYRSQKRDIETEVIYADFESNLNLKNVNFVFIGGGPDSGQKDVYDDLFNYRSDFLRNYIEDGGAGLFVCGSYQLLGNYYKSADGTVLKGLGIFDMYTEHFGARKPRCIGNVLCTLESSIKDVSEFLPGTAVDTELVGFENHGGRTYLGSNVLPFARIIMGYGNNGEDKTEGIVYKNAVGTYLHGPVLARNPYLADYFISKSLGIEKLEKLEKPDDIITALAHTASKKLKQ